MSSFARPLATKLGRVVTYDEENSIHNDTWPSDHVITWDLVTNEKLHIPSSTRSITTKYGRLVTYGERNPTMESHVSLTTWSCVFTPQNKSVIYKTFKMYGHQTLYDADMWKSKMKLHDSLITSWPRGHHVKSSHRGHYTRVHVSNWKHNTSSSPLLWPPNMAGWWLMVTQSHPYSLMTLWLRSRGMLREKRKA